MQQGDHITSAEFLLFAGGNEDRQAFLLGYVSSSIPDEIRAEAVRARLRFEADGEVWKTTLDLARSEVYDPRD
jgi:hypothetical protein